jgi:hypothetical protein
LENWNKGIHVTRFVLSQGTLQTCLSVNWVFRPFGRKDQVLVPVGPDVEPRSPVSRRTMSLGMSVLGSRRGTGFPDRPRTEKNLTCFAGSLPHRFGRHFAAAPSSMHLRSLAAPYPYTSENKSPTPWLAPNEQASYAGAPPPARAWAPKRASKVFGITVVVFTRFEYCWRKRRSSKTRKTVAQFLVNFEQSIGRWFCFRTF